MSAFLKSNFLNSNDASTIRRQNGSNNSLSDTLQLTLVSAVPKKAAEGFLPQRLLFDNPSQRRNINVTGPSFVSDTCIWAPKTPVSVLSPLLRTSSTKSS